MASVGFNVDGPGINEIILERYYGPDADAKNAISLCNALMVDENNTISEKQRQRLIEDILLGRAKFTGNTKDGSFCLTTYSPDDDDAPNIPDYQNIFKLFEEAQETINNLRKDYKRMCEWYAIAMSRIEREDNRNIVFSLTGQLDHNDYEIRNLYMPELLNNIVEYSKDIEEHSTDDYGWLEPNGKFHGVPWGDHEEWASNYFKEKSDDEWRKILDNHHDVPSSSPNMGNFGDELCNRGWILLHSPYNSFAQITMNPRSRMTNKQKDFLYDYYMERNQEDKANALYEDDYY